MTGSIFTTSGTVRQAILPVGTCLVETGRSVYTSTEQTFSDWLRPVHEHYQISGSESVAEMLNEIIVLTGWSHRRVASLFGTSHPTIASVLRGHAPNRVSGLEDAISDTFDLVRKLAEICGRDKDWLSKILLVKGEEGYSPLDLINSGDHAGAYLTALDFLRPQQAEESLVVSDMKRVPHLETEPLADE
ncbi:hypothetical protein [Amycolatopsis sp. NBC_00438]|uniref:hypothetical protein n=1 Tax=Amycolatopsis sp. NBC_00438 TaxID=2903558 RepID=UPI002E229BC6